MKNYISRKTTIKRFSTVAIILVLSINILQTVYLPVITSAQANNAVWVNKSRIDYNGSHFDDSNIWNKEVVYQGEQQGNNCYNLIVPDKGDDTRGTYLTYTVQPDGKCGNTGSKQIQIDGTNGSVIFYKLSDSVVLAIQAFACNPVSNDTIDGIRADLYGYTYYRKWGDAPGEPSDRQGAYFRSRSDGTVSKDEFIKDNGNGSGNIRAEGCRGGLQSISRTGAFKDGGEIVNVLPDGAPDPPSGIELPDSLKHSDGTAVKTGGTASSVAPSCESNNGTIIIGWLICGILTALDQAVSTATNVVNDLLTVKGEDMDTQELHQVWSMFRVIASIALLGIALVMIIGQAMSGE